MYISILYIPIVTINEKDGMGLKQSKEECKGRFRERKG